MGAEMKINLHLKNKKIVKNLIFFISGTLMIAHASRMIYQGIFQQGTSYTPNTFDLFFDWATLLMLVILVFFFSLASIYNKLNKKNKIKEEKQIGYFAT